MLQIYLFGALRFVRHGVPYNFSALPKTAPLCAYLLLHRERPIGRTTLAFALWPDVGEAEARSNLRRHLYELRRILPPESPDCPWLLTETNSVQWNEQAPFWLDVDEFLRLRTTATGLQEAVACYQGDLLPALNDDWVLFARERLRNLFFDDLGKLITLHRQQQQYPEAIAYTQQLLTHDPLREDAVRELMRLRHASGDRSGALQEYRLFEQQARKELAVEPMLETKALYDTIAQDLLRPAPATPTPPIAQNRPATLPLAASPTPQANRPDPLFPPTNLPAQLTSFIGRQADLAHLSDWLASNTTHQRLITLTGPGGSGKSRLASEVLARLGQSHPKRFPHGIFTVWLANLQRAEQVLPAIANTLNINETPGRPLRASLQDYLRDKQLCLLLDNFEHLLAAAGEIRHLLEAAPQLVVVATSRAALQLYGEHEFPVSPLTLPERHEQTEPTTLANYSAVALFVARSRAVNPNFALNEQNSADVAEICRRLDGLPLAVELAAARSKLLTPQAILARMGAAADGLRFLADRNRSQNERHQTLQAAIEWSYKLLTPAEQQLFTYLAVFPHNFTLEQAEAICDLEGRRDRLEHLEVLVNSSLLQQVEEEAQIHFRYLWTIRDFAHKQLRQNPTQNEQLNERHARYFLAWATAHMLDLYGFQQGAAQRKLQAAHANLRAAWEWALQRQQVEIGLAFAGVLARYWLGNSHLLNEGRAYLEKLLALPTAQSPSAERAMALVSAAILEMHYARQTYPRQIALYEECLQIAERLQNADLINTARLGLVRPLLNADAFERVPRLLEQSLAHFRRTQQPWSLGAALWSAALVARHVDDVPQAQALTTEAIALFQTVGDQWWINFVLRDLAMAHHQRGDFAIARSLYERCLPLARTSGDRVSVALVLVNLADLSLLGADYHQAEEYAQTALTLFLDLGEQWQPPRLLRILGLIAIQRGDLPRAISLCHEAIAHCRELDNLDGLSACVGTLASVLAKRNEFAGCVTLLAAAETRRQGTSQTLLSADIQEYERTLATARAALSSEAFASAWAIGESLTIEQAILRAPHY